MARRGEYRLTLTADGRVLRQELKKSESDLKSFQASTKKVSAELEDMARGSAGSLGKLGGLIADLGPAGLAAAAGIGAVVTAATAVGVALVNVTKQAVDYGGTIADAAAKNQMGVETFQALSQGLALTGVSMQELQKATTEMQKELVKSPKTFKNLGLEAERLRAMDPADAFLQTAKAIASIEDPASRTAAAFDAFGKSGVAIAAAVSQMGDAAERAKELGNVMSADVIAGLDQTGDAATTLQTTWEHLWLNIGAAIGTAPGVADGIDKITDAIGELSTFIIENQAEIQKLVSDVFPAVVQAAVGLVQVIQTLVSTVLELKRAWDFSVPSWVKELGFASVGMGGMFGGAGSGRPVNPIAKNTARPGAALVGPGVGRKPTRGARGGSDRESERFVKAAEEARAAWDKFFADMERRSASTMGGMQKDIDKYVDDLAKRNTNIAMDALDKKQESEEAAAKKLLEDQRLAEEGFQQMVGAIHDVAGGFDYLGGVVGGTFGAILQGAGSVIHSIGDIKTSLRSIQNAGGGIGGILGKVAGGIGLAGAAFSIGKTIFGGIKSLFGGKKKEEKPVETLADQFKRVSSEAQKAGTVGSKALRDIIDKARAAKEKLPEVEAFIKEQIGRATGSMGGITGTLKDGKVTGGLAIATPESAKAQAVIFTSTFWAAVKEQGLVAAVDALQAPFEALREKLTSGGFDVGALLGSVGGIFGAAGVEGPARSALEAVDALKEALEGVANAGYLTAESFSAFQTASQDAFNQAVAGGLTTQQAYQAIAPMLASIISASNEYGIAIDENTQAMIEQAKAAGVAFPADPIIQMRDAVRELVNEIRTLNGLPQRDWGEMPPTTGGGGTASTTPVGVSDATSAAGGFPLQRLGRDTVFRAHAGETAMVVPKGGFGGGDGQAGFGATTFAPNVTIQVDTHGEVSTMKRFLSKIEQATYDAIMAGKSPVLKALQDRGGIRK